MSFAEQIRVFNEAEFIAGVSGAALTNSIWCEPGTTVLSLAPANGAEFFFWDLSNICGHRFITLFGAVDGLDKGVHSDFGIDLKLLEEVLSFTSARSLLSTN
jgi:capsular polysaccharide biosynthesis protein